MSSISLQPGIAPTPNLFSTFFLLPTRSPRAAASQAAQDASLSRMAQAGAVRVTTVPTVLEFQRDWARREYYDALMGILKEHAGAYGVGIEYAYTLVHHAAQSAKKPQVVPKKSH